MVVGQKGLAVPWSRHRDWVGWEEASYVLFFLFLYLFIPEAGAEILKLWRSY